MAQKHRLLASRRSTVLAGLVAVCCLAITTVYPGQASAGGTAASRPDAFTVRGLSGTVAPSRASAAGHAQTARSLLALTGTAPTQIVVKLAFTPVSTYVG